MFPRQYLVIDYGTSYIKGILFKEVLGTVSILRKESLKIVRFGESAEDEYEYNMVRFVQSFFPEESRFIINLPLEKLFIRDIIIPVGIEASRFNPDKVIKESMPYEVENVVPFPIEEMIVQGSIWKREKESSMVITYTAHVNEVEKSANPFLRENISLKCISTDPYSLSCIPLFFYGKSILDTNIGQLDIGGKVSIFNLCTEGKVTHSRYFTGGGDFVTEKIQKLLDLSLEEAEEIKHSIDFSIIEPTEEEIESFRKKHSLKTEQVKAILDYIRESLVSIAGEVTKSIHTIHGNARPSVIYLSGGGSLFLGVEQFLQGIIGIPFKRYDFLEIQDDIFVGALGAGYHYRYPKQNRVDFLTPELTAKLNKTAFKISNYYPHLILFSLGALILGIGFGLGIYHDKKKIAQFQEALRAKFKQGFGRELSEEEDALSAARSEVNKEKKKSEIVRLFLSKESILDVIHEMTVLFPPKEEFNFLLEQFTYDADNNSVYIDGRVDDFQELGQIQSAFEKSKLIKNMEIQNKRLFQGANKLRVAFKMRVDLAVQDKSGKEKSSDAE
ncbi:MAG: cell division protein FtsA [Candidatus Pacearchaeota archaeon]